MCIATDVELGPTVERVHPPGVLTAKECQTVSNLSFPDSTWIVGGILEAHQRWKLLQRNLLDKLTLTNLGMTYFFRFRTDSSGAANASRPKVPPYLFGYVHFRQTKVMIAD